MLKNKNKTLDQYQSPMAGMSNRQLRFSGWYVRHKSQFRQLGKAALFVFALVTMSYALYGWSMYLLIGYKQDKTIFQNLISQFSNYDNLKPLYEAQPLDFSATKIFPSSDGQYDFVTEVRNTNSRQVAVISFSYTLGENLTKPQDTIVLPGQTTLLVAFGQETGSYPAGVRLNVLHIAWHRINPHQVFNVSEYISDRLLFTIANFSFSRATARSDVPSHRLTFDITNESAYSYWQPKFIVKLLASDQLVGVLPLTIDRFKSTKTYSLELRSLAPDLIVSQIVLVPLIDVFDEREFILPR